MLTETLKLLHPFMPFITEEIWQALPHEGDYLMLQQWPRAPGRAGLPRGGEGHGADHGRHPGRAHPPGRDERAPLQKGAASPSPPWSGPSLAAGIPFLKRLAYASDVTVEGVADAGSDDAMTAQGMVTVITHAARLFMPLAELVDLEKEKARIQKELQEEPGRAGQAGGQAGQPRLCQQGPRQRGGGRAGAR